MNALCLHKLFKMKLVFLYLLLVVRGVERKRQGIDGRHRSSFVVVQEKAESWTCLLMQ